MRINTNISAMNTYGRLTNANAAKSESLSKLSSGLRINKAGDDAAGLAISEKMKGQVGGLKQAVRNAQDGVSLIQTAEGALNETHAILGRMRDLANQGANGTLSEDDRGEINKEFTALKEEITRISNTTEFNTKKLLNTKDQDFTFQIGANGGQTMSVKIGKMDADTLGLTADVKLANDDDATAADLKVKEGAYTNAQTALKDAQKSADTLKEIKAAKDQDVNSALTELGRLNNAVTAIDDEISASLAAQGGALDTDAATDIPGGRQYATDGIPAYGSNLANATPTWADVKAYETSLKADATDAVTAQKIVLYGETSAGSGTPNAPGDGAAGSLEAIASSAGQAYTNKLDEINTASTGLKAVFEGAEKDYQTALTAADTQGRTAASDAIAKIDEAIKAVSAQRSDLGAAQNRLSHTVKNLTTTQENLAEANSRIRDVDMAEEMMSFTKSNILSQAATSMLSQANAMPNSVLGLLQG